MKAQKLNRSHLFIKTNISKALKFKRWPNDILTIFSSVQFSSVQSLSRVWLFATPWIAARQASLSITISWSSLRLMSIESVMPSSHLILCHPLLLLPPIPPSIRSFSNESTLPWGGQSTGASALASFLLTKSQGWSPSEWTGSNQERSTSRLSIVTLLI